MELLTIIATVLAILLLVDVTAINKGTDSRDRIGDDCATDHRVATDGATCLPRPGVQVDARPFHRSWTLRGSAGDLAGCFDIGPSPFSPFSVAACGPAASSSNSPSTAASASPASPGAPASPSIEASESPAASIAFDVKEFDVPVGLPSPRRRAGRGWGAWYTGQHVGTLGHLDPSTGTIREIPLGAGSAPHA